MKRIKKLLILMLSTLMLLGTMSITAFAASDSSVTVSGLDAGDQVKIYKLIKWTDSGWAWADGVEAAATAASVTLPDISTITGGALTAETGGILAQAAQKLSAPATTLTVASGASSVTYSKPASMSSNDFLGLYVALVTPATTDYLYNPIFVAADFNAGNNSIGVVVDQLSYTDTALAKKENVTLTKTVAEIQYDVAVGDEIAFTVNSVIPEFSSSYVDPVYVLTDTLQSGLEMVANSVEVKVRTKGSGSYAALAAANYDLNSTTSGFTLALKSAYLKGLTGAMDIQVTYKAKIKELVDVNVLQKENKATVKFSNDPSDSTSYSLLEDRTYHYTFSLDALLLGNNKWENSELVKVGLNPDGSEITETITLDNGVTAGVLEGAVFGLYTDQACTTLYTNNNVTPAITGQYTSDENGKLNISGLDAGIYYLKEIQAPEGYIAGTDTYKIEIKPKYKTVNGGTYVNSDGITVKYDAYDILESYEVIVTNLKTNTAVTSSFVMSNDGTSLTSHTDNTTKLPNTKGTELPTTGGIGTTIFYIVGSLLVLGAALLIVTRRRMNSGR